MGSRWRIRFSVTYRRLGESGGRIALQAGEDKLIWTGADSVYGKMSSFIGSSMIDTRTPDIGRPYWFEFRRENGELSLRLDGNLLGRGPATKNPDVLFVGSDDSVAAGTDTYLDVADVSLETSAASNPRNDAVGQPSAATLDRMRLVLGVDPLATPPAVPSGDRLRVSARESRVVVAPRDVVEFAPVSDLPDFKPTEVALFADGNLVRRVRVVGKTMPVFSYEAPDRSDVPVRLRVRAADDARRQVELMRTDLSTSSTQLTGFKTIQEKDAIRLDGPVPDGLFVFLGDVYLGRVLSSSAFSLDIRRLPPGRYALRVITSNEGGALLPPHRVPVEVRPRYALSTAHDLGVLNLEGKVDGTTLQVQMEQEASPTLTRVYLRGALVATKEGRQFECRLPMGDVPSGPIEVHVVGVGEDGTLYPPESLTLRVKNPVWDALQARDEKAKRLDALQEQLGEDDEKVAYWYSRASSEPTFRAFAASRTILTSDEFGRMASVTYISSLVVSGDASRYLAECRAAILRRAAKRLQLGKLQRDLGLREQARSTFERCIEEAGVASATALAAKQELSVMR